MATMRAVEIKRAGGPFEFVHREIPSAAAGTVRIKVEACGICHSDMFTKEGAFPGIEFPRVPGHEVIGRDRRDRRRSARLAARVSASAWAGTAVIAATAHRAGAAISSPARTAGSPASATTADTPST